MTAKIGRNDPCPCGSGKKYKHCHMQQAAGEQTAEFPFPTVAEPFALGRLLSASRAFQRTYEAERTKIGPNLAWTSKLPMPPEVAAQAIRLPNAPTRILYVRQLPAETAHAFAIAHELLHLVLDAEGFPIVTTQSEQTALAAVFNSMVQDPLINARLAQYGFSNEKKLQRDLGIALLSMQQAPPPQDAATRHLWAWNYASQLLECTIVRSSILHEQLEVFQNWFRKTYPMIAAEGEELVRKAQSLGYNTPERMGAFFEWAIQHSAVSADFVITRRA